MLSPSGSTSFCSPSRSDVTHPSGSTVTPLGQLSLPTRALPMLPSSGDSSSTSVSSSITTSAEPGSTSPIFCEFNDGFALRTSFAFAITCLCSMLLLVTMMLGSALPCAGVGLSADAFLRFLRGRGDECRRVPDLLAANARTMMSRWTAESEAAGRATTPQS